MPDGTVILVLIVLGLIFIAAVVGVFAVLSNNRGNLETIEDANRRLVEVREEYNAFNNFPTGRRRTKYE